MSGRIVIKRENKQLNVYQGNEYIASIFDHRFNPERKTKNTSIKDRWNVCWRSGRVDWHGRYQEARDNALKGPANKQPSNQRSGNGSR